MPPRCRVPSGHNLLTTLTIASAVGGVALGFLLRSLRDQESWWTAREVRYVAFPGELYLRALTMFVIPLLISAVVAGIASLDLQASWQIAARSALWFITTQYIAVVLGIIVAVAIRPGIGVTAGSTKDYVNHKSMGVDTALDVFRNMFPENFIQANIVHTRTLLDKNDSLPIEDWKIHVNQVDGVNIPGIITVSIALGVALSVAMPAGRPVLEICEVLSKSMMMAIEWVLWSTPVAVLFMVTAKLMVEQDLAQLLERLGLYFVSVLVGLFLHGLIILPSMYFAFTRKSPFQNLKHVAQPLATAFGTASSNAALPQTMDCLENRAGIDSRLVRFLAPIATNLNMNGTALYEAAAIVFISQLRGAPLDFSHYLLISVTVTAACLGNAGIPQAGLVTMVLLLTSLNLPPGDVSLIVAVDWLLDRFRTTVNVIGVSLATGAIEYMSQDQLMNIGKKRYEEVPQAEHQDEEVEEYELSERL